MAAVAMPVAGRGPRWRRRGWFDIAKAQRRRAVATARVAARGRGCRGRRCLAAAVGDAGAAPPPAAVGRPARDPARIALVVVAGVAAAVVADEIGRAHV